MDNNYQIICNSCGRGLTLENVGTFFHPSFVVPVHNIIKNNGTKSSVKCKESGKKIAIEIKKIDSKAKKV